MLLITSGMLYTEAVPNWLGGVTARACARAGQPLGKMGRPLGKMGRPLGEMGRIRVRALIVMIALMALVAAPVPTAVAQNQIWLTQFGTSGIDIAYALAPDGIGGVMVAGHTAGIFGGPNAGGQDVFLSRCDEDGKQLWAVQIGTLVGESARALAPDGVGGVFIAGYTWFNLGGQNAGGTDVFLARYDDAGNQLWIRQFGTRSDEWATALAPDGAGGVIVAGFTRGSLGGPTAGSSDAFLARYDSAGTRLWIKQFGTSASEWAWALEPDGAGGVMVAGTARRVVLSSTVIESFVGHYDENGHELWTTTIRGGVEMRANAVALDGAGGVIVAGAVTSNSGAHPGGFQAFIARLDEKGQEVWRRLLGSAAHANALVSDGAGGVVVAGLVNGALGGPSAGRNDVWIARFDAGGNRLWLRQFGTSWWDEALALASDGAGGVMVAGSTLGTNPNRTVVLLARYTIDSCYADCDQSNGTGVLDLLDFLCWQEDFMAGNSYACDCETSTGQLVCDIFDFLCFQDAFVGGCP